jgi:mRNA interferase RelE/StbE
VKVEFKTSFLKDIKDISKVKNKTELKRIKEVIENIEKNENLQEIADLKKLRGGDHFYRIKVGEYRLGLSISEHSCIFIRCLHRKDIYRYFP